MAYQGIFKPKNPQKYKGDANNIIYRSRWELVCMSKFDTHPNILSWSSEEIIIKYRSPIDGRVHRYFTDFFIEMQDKNGYIRKVLIEVKPKAQTVPPKPKSGKPTRGYLNEVKTWGVNEAKWKAAREVCAQEGWDFEILTEDEIFGKGKKGF